MTDCFGQEVVLGCASRAPFLRGTYEVAQRINTHGRESQFIP